MRLCVWRKRRIATDSGHPFPEPAQSATSSHSLRCIHHSPDLRARGVTSPWRRLRPLSRAPRLGGGAVLHCALRFPASRRSLAAARLLWRAVGFGLCMRHRRASASTPSTASAAVRGPSRRLLGARAALGGAPAGFRVGSFSAPAASAAGIVPRRRRFLARTLRLHPVTLHGCSLVTGRRPRPPHPRRAWLLLARPLNPIASSADGVFTHTATHLGLDPGRRSSVGSARLPVPPPRDPSAWGRAHARRIRTPCGSARRFTRTSRR